MNNITNAKEFMARMCELDADADRVVGESVVPYEDILELALKEYSAYIHNATIEKAIDTVSDIGANYRDYDPDRDGRNQTNSIKSALKEQLITKENIYK